ncbi:MAG: dihydropteroate synthase [Actinobacteria bacterium]|nr:dihydropteroate synthase [Actinomycetota bacterium]
MGVVNVTPDSFSDGGRFLAADAALEQALTLVGEGASIVDIGGESTRPGSEAVPLEEELRRVLPVVEALAGSVGVPISVDTMKAEVARRALASGATIVNDVSALRFDDGMVDLVAETGCPVCLMHMKGQPKTMQDDPRYDDVVDEVLGFLEERIAFALSRGVREEQIMVDPGLGFGKTVAHNLALLDDLDRFSSLGRPVLLGASRKRFLGAILGAEPADRMIGTVATTVIGYLAGAHIFRVHDVKPNFEALRVALAVREGVTTP